MSNMMGIKTALDAEIKYAKEGIAFYSTRIAALEKMIQQLDLLDGIREMATPTGKKKRAGSTKTAAASMDDGGVSAISAANDRSVKLPATTAKFWLSLLSEEPISNKDIIKGAIAALKLRPTPADLTKLKQRLANAITIMTKDGSMQSEGTGRARRFFVKNQ